MSQLLIALPWWRLHGYQAVKKRTKCLIPSSLSSNAGLISPGSGASLVGLRDRDECLASPGASPSPLRPFISFHEGLFRFSASSFSRLKTGHLQKNKNAKNIRPVEERKKIPSTKRTNKHINMSVCLDEMAEVFLVYLFVVCICICVLT